MHEGESEKIEDGEEEENEEKSEIEMKHEVNSTKEENIDKCLEEDLKNHTCHCSVKGEIYDYG